MAVLAVCLAADVAGAQDSRIRLNTLGFLPDQSKVASVAAPATDFALVRTSDGAKVFQGKVGPVAVNPDTKEELARADFSGFKTPGAYRLEIAGVGKSAEFRIAPDVYNDAFRTVVRGMYLWRCGTAVSATHNGQTFAHDACHTDDAYLDFVGGGHVKKPSVGGWHDAGDYNKYVVNAGFTVGVMLHAWEQFGPRIQSVQLGLPEAGRGTPEYLSEIRWELEWMLSMQADDGRVYHKLSTQKFGGFVMPERETTPRFFTPWSSAATCDLVATMAMAARDFEPYDKAFAGRCLDAAKRSYAYLVAHPENHRADLKGFSTGDYQANDAPRRLWAAAELWQTTGEAPCLHDFETRARTGGGKKIDRQCGWANVKNLAMYTYLLSKRDGRDATLVADARKDLLDVANDIVKTRDAHGYARPLGAVYFWGCNGDVAQQVQTLRIADALAPDRKYVEASLDAIGHLLGRNCYGRSFVTGVGRNPPLHPHDRRSGADKISHPWPGYLVGGGWPKPTDWHDDQADYRTNEIAINWNATLIYALAGFVQSDAR